MFAAFGIGANDVANAYATSVGSGALSIKSAVVLAGIFEFAGATFLGSHVSDTIRKKIGACGKSLRRGGRRVPPHSKGQRLPLKSPHGGT